jgi:pseudoazurin
MFAVKALQHCFAATQKGQKGKKMKYISFTTAAFAAMMITGAAYAADHQVQMLNKGTQGVMVFEPNFIEAAPGDTVTFVPTDKGHDASSIDGMLPEGAQPFKGEISKPITVTIDKEGVYGVKCVPHYGMGMVALIVAGKPANLDQAKKVKQPGKAKKVFEELFAKVPAGN